MKTVLSKLIYNQWLYCSRILQHVCSVWIRSLSVADEIKVYLNSIGRNVGHRCHVRTTFRENWREYGRYARRFYVLGISMIPIGFAENIFQFR